jgi:hypothetical protein
LGGQIICDHTMVILHQVYVVIHALRLVKSMDTLHLTILFEKVNVAFLTPKNAWKIGVKNIPPKNISSKYKYEIVLFQWVMRMFVKQVWCIA